MKTINQLMVHSSKLSSLLEKSKKIKLFEEKLKASLQTPLNQHCHVANLRETTLVVIADSSLWATKFRYMTQQLLVKWQNDPLMHTIQQMEVKVRPPAKIEKPPCPNNQLLKK